MNLQHQGRLWLTALLAASEASLDRAFLPSIILCTAFSFWQLCLRLHNLVFGCGISQHHYLWIDDIDKLNDGFTELMVACRRFSIEDVQYLLKRGANVNMVSKDGDTALLIAVKHYYPSPTILQCLLEHGADANARQKDGETALILLTCDEKTRTTVSDRHRMIDLLLQHGADVNRWHDGNTPLMDILWRYHGMTGEETPDFSMAAIRARMRSRLKTSDYRFIAERLLHNGANVNASSDLHGNTPLMIALAHRERKEGDIEDAAEHRRIVQLLLNNGADVNAVHPVSRKTPLLVAASVNHSSEVFQMILDTPGVDIHAQDIHGRSALYLATSKNDVQAVSSLLHLGANPNAADATRGIPALENAIRFGYAQIAMLLLHAGANVHGWPTPPLIPAVRTRHLDVIAEILKVDGVDVNAKDEDGVICALDNCLNERRYYAKAASLLLQHGANANGVRADRGTTPLIDVIEYDYPKMMDVFLKHNADVDVPTGDLNQTPLQAAVRHGRAHYVRQLLQYGADWRPCLVGGTMSIPECNKAAVEAEFCEFFRQQGAHYCAVREALRRTPIPSDSEFFEGIRGFLELTSEEEYETIKKEYHRMGGKAPRAAPSILSCKQQ